ncbi:hypothetical protein PO909_000613 [Leuciscus waleckii]
MWKDMSRREVKTAALSPINFSKPKRKDSQLKDILEKSGKLKGQVRYFTKLTADDLRDLRDLAPNAAIFTSVDLSDTDSASELDTETNLPEPVKAVYDKQLRGLPPHVIKQKSLEMFQRVRKKLTSDQCEALEFTTREQSKCRAWHTHREGRITSTNLHHLCTAGEPTDNDIKNIMHYKTEDLQVPAIRWGRQMEDTARKCYIEEMSKGHTNFFARLSLTSWCIT